MQLLRLLCLALLLSYADSFFSNLVPSAPKNSVPDGVKLLILPGFGNDSVDYCMDRSLVDSLKEKGWKSDQIRVLPVQRSDWLQVFLRGLLDWKFWTAQAPPTRPAFRWYLERISGEIEALGTDESIILVGHSAGGWLGRAALGYGSLKTGDEDGPPVDLSKVLGIVTLGAPNLPPPPQIMDMTRGALKLTNERFPGAFHKPDMFYVTAIGKAIVGEKQVRQSPLEPTSVRGFAYNSYEAVCGDGTTIGDGVVPHCAGHLDDAVQLDLEGVLHSINAPDNWYGSSGVIDLWHTPMLDALASSSGGRVGSMPKFEPSSLFGFSQ